MLRDTPRGLSISEAQPIGRRKGWSRQNLRSPDGPTASATLAVGVIVDPNISMPLPFAGLSYVDFNLFGTGTQLSAFFGGTYGQLAFSAPSLGGTRWQLAGRAFAHRLVVQRSRVRRRA